MKSEVMRYVRIFGVGYFFFQHRVCSSNIVNYQWAAQNRQQSYGVWDQRRPRSACASVHSDQRLSSLLVKNYFKSKHYVSG